MKKVFILCVVLIFHKQIVIANVLSKTNGKKMIYVICINKNLTSWILQKGYSDSLKKSQVQNS